MSTVDFSAATYRQSTGSRLAGGRKDDGWISRLFEVDLATGEGKILGWLLSLFGLGVFGYLTASLASHFIERDRRTIPVAPEPGDLLGRTTSEN